MRIIFRNNKTGEKFPRSIKKDAKAETEKKIKKQLGRHISSLHEIQENGAIVYTEENERPYMFSDLLQPGKYYFFGHVQTKKSTKGFFFLTEIEKPLSIGKEHIIFDSVKTIKVTIKSKTLW